MIATIGDIINLVCHTSVSFDEGELRLCESSDGIGSWFSVLDVSMSGLYMSNGEIWDFQRLTHGEIQLVFQTCKEVVSIVDASNYHMHQLPL